MSAVDDLEPTLREHPFLAGFTDAQVGQLAGCARHAGYDADGYLFHEGAEAREFFLLRSGRVALEITVPGRGRRVIATLGAGDVVGASWLVPPYRWTFDARALEPVGAIGIDVACLRDKCEADHDLGYTVMKSFLPVFVQRLHGTRLQLLDVYGAH